MVARAYLADHPETVAGAGSRRTHGATSAEPSSGDADVPMWRQRATWRAAGRPAVGRAEKVIPAAHQHKRQSAGEAPGQARCCDPWDGDCALGPFQDVDGTEILPCTTEATDELLAECMGCYRVVANIPGLNGQTLLLCNHLLTKYIQDNWSEVMGEGEWAGFLLAYQSAPKAVGRLAEDVLCQELVAMLLPGHGTGAGLIPVAEACRSGHLVQPGRGYRTDDLFVLTGGGRGWLVESKASFAGTSYLRRSLPKALAQLHATARANPMISDVLLALSAVRQKRITVAHLPVARLLGSQATGLIAEVRHLMTAHDAGDQG